MPSVAVKLYSVFFKFLLKHRLQNRIQTPFEDADPFGITSRPEESVAPANPSFGGDGVATKDIHIDTITSLSVRIFLPESCLARPEPPRVQKSNSKRSDSSSVSGSGSDRSDRNSDDLRPRRNSYGAAGSAKAAAAAAEAGRFSLGGSGEGEALKMENGVYRGYAPMGAGRKLPVLLQFHGGGFVSGSNDSVANDFFCRRIAKICDVIVIAVGYRLAPENRYPAAFEDGWKVLNWLGKQAILADCSKSMGKHPPRGGGHGAGAGGDPKRADLRRHIVDTFGSSMVEPWLAAHADPSSPVGGAFVLVWVAVEQCVLLGVSCGANIADYVTRKAVEAGTLLDPIKVVAQVLMYPFFIGSVPTHSEIKLANSYFYDKAMCILAWKLFLPEDEFSLDHPAANPLIPGREPPFKCMPPTLTIVAEHDWMRDRAIAYSEELRKVNIDAPVLEYKDAVHEFATLDMLLKTPQAQACAEDIAIWVKKYISIRGHEFSY
ncbi:hypothetical protein Sjap_016385 [Stephania japonica]|uniref:Alpha/beta hydrolase fold-3 domain-containing protein n=1 Tax=Stephania japonica TaxID=461633 RepID=A0AAP0IM34_9MAGN